jgi:hypothetical protein
MPLTALVGLALTIQIRAERWQSGPPLERFEGKVVTGFPSQNAH